MMPFDDNYDYTWITDIGHAPSFVPDTPSKWLRVRKDEYHLTGYQATGHSYQDDKYVYLEEDVDAPAYLRLHQPNPKDIPEEHYNGLSPVRQMKRIRHHFGRSWGGTPDHPFHYD